MADYLGDRVPRWWASSIRAFLRSSIGSSSIDIVLRRFAEYHDLEGAFGRRAVTERAKGILMERHSVDERSAVAMLLSTSRNTNRKLIDVATAVVDRHRLLPKVP